MKTNKPVILLYFITRQTKLGIHKLHCTPLTVLAISNTIIVEPDTVIMPLINKGAIQQLIATLNTVYLDTVIQKISTKCQFSNVFFSTSLWCSRQQDRTILTINLHCHSAYLTAAKIHTSLLPFLITIQLKSNYNRANCLLISRV